MKGKAEAAKLIYDSIIRIQEGKLTVILQDNRILQINVDEKYGGTLKEASLNQEKELFIEKSRLEADIQKMLDLAQTIHFGSVTAIIYEGKIIQVEKTEKIRII